MKKEYSYGAVVYQYIDNKLVFLIEYMTLGHISLPKGHIEKGETPIQCTIREIKEETNLDVDVDTSFSRVITYLPKPNVSKDVTFFLATPKTFDLKPQLEEVIDMKWVSYEEALSLLSFKSDQETVKAAYQAILAKKK